MLDVKDITLTRNERIVLEAILGTRGSAATLWDLRDRLDGLPIGTAGRLAVKLEKMGLVKLFRVGVGGRKKEYVITSSGVEALKGFDVVTNGEGTKEIDDEDMLAIRGEVREVAPTSDMLSARKISPPPDPAPLAQSNVVFVVTDKQLAEILETHVTGSIRELLDLRQANADLQGQLDAALLAVAHHKEEIAQCRRDAEAALKLAEEATNKNNAFLRALDAIQRAGHEEV